MVAGELVETWGNTPGTGTEGNDGDELGRDEYGRGAWPIEFWKRRGVTLGGRGLLCKKSHDRPFKQKPLLFRNGHGVRCLGID